MIENLGLVILDMDGLMFNSERAYCEAVLEIVKDRQIDVDESVLYKSVGSSYFDMEKFFHKGIPEGFDMKRELTGAVNDAVTSMCTDGVPKKPGLDELLAVLQEKGIKFCVATSSAIERSGRLLESAGVMPLLEFVITGDEVARGKPYPDIFVTACEKAGVPREKALVLEDSINGGKAARAAGIRYIIVPDINPPTEEVIESALAVVDTLHEVVELISS
jgi:HAD superfamily hydrolase (TIGR01509 family)